jgi:hypothetical protein
MASLLLKCGGTFKILKTGALAYRHISVPNLLRTNEMYLAVISLDKRQTPKGSVPALASMAVTVLFRSV